MVARLLARLDEAIARARHPVEAACLRAERAGALARLGQLGPAREALQALRVEFALQPRPAVSAWLHLVDGLLDHYSAFAPTARDKIAQAHALAGAAGLTRLRALSAAWLAQMEFGRGCDEAIARGVAEALALAAPDDHATLGRVALVVAHCYHGAGRRDLAQPWHARARDHAVADGDSAMLSALMHNQNWLRCGDARMAELFGDGAGEEAQRALTGAESTAHFDAGLGSGSLRSTVPMLRAQLLVLNRRPREALALFDAHLDAAMAEGLQGLRASFLADMAWCHEALGEAARARALALQAEPLAAAQQPDDEALALAQLARVWQRLGDDAAAQRLRRGAEAAHARFTEASGRLVALMDAALASVAPAKRAGAGPDRPPGGFTAS